MELNFNTILEDGSTDELGELLVFKQRNIHLMIKAMIDAPRWGLQSRTSLVIHEDAENVILSAEVGIHRGEINKIHDQRIMLV